MFFFFRVFFPTMTIRKLSSPTEISGRPTSWLALSQMEPAWLPALLTGRTAASIQITSNASSARTCLLPCGLVIGLNTYRLVSLLCSIQSGGWWIDCGIGRQASKDVVLLVRQIHSTAGDLRRMFYVPLQQRHGLSRNSSIRGHKVNCSCIPVYLLIGFM